MLSPEATEALKKIAREYVGKYGKLPKNIKLLTIEEQEEIINKKPLKPSTTTN